MLKKIINIAIAVVSIMILSTFTIRVMAWDGDAHHNINTVEVLGKKLPVLRYNKLPILIVGPASLFYENYLPSSFGRYFEPYFVDIFEKTATNISIHNLTSDDLVDAIEKIRKNLQLDKVVLFGHSSNGILALKYSYKYHEHVICNILVGTTPFRGNDKDEISKKFFDEYASRARKLIYQDDNNNLNKISNPSFFDQYNAKRALNFFDPEDTRGANIWQKTNLDEDLINKYFSLIDSFNIKQEETKFTVPTFLALGAHDYSCPYVLWDLRNDKPHETQHKKETFIMFDDPFLKTHIFDKSSHFPMIEQENDFMQALLEFLKDRKLFSSDKNNYG